jgi:hypothetical protein
VGVSLVECSDVCLLGARNDLTVLVDRQLLVAHPLRLSLEPIEERLLVTEPRGDRHGESG